MAVEKSNNMFDWCDKIARAKTNYSDAECLEILKKRVAGIGGIDQGFYNKVSSATMNISCITNPVKYLKANKTK